MKEKKNLLVMDTTEGIANAIGMRIGEIISDDSQKLKDLQDIMCIGKPVVNMIAANFLTRGIIDQPVRTKCDSFRQAMVKAAKLDTFDMYDSNAEIKDRWFDPECQGNDDFLSTFNLPSMIITRAVDLAWSRVPASVKDMFIEFMAQLVIWTDDHQMTDNYPLVFNDNFWFRLHSSLHGETITSHKRYFMDPALVNFTSPETIEYKVYYANMMICLLCYFTWNHIIITNRMTTDADMRYEVILPFLTLIVADSTTQATDAWLMFMNKEQEVLTASHVILKVEQPWLATDNYVIPDIYQEQRMVLLLRSLMWNYQMILAMRRVNR